MPLNFKKLPYLYCLPVLGILLTTACQKSELYKPKHLPEPTLYVLAQIDPHLGVQAFISIATAGADTVYYKDILVTKASVAIESDQGENLIIPHKKQGLYALDSTTAQLKVGHSYRIAVSGVPGLEDVLSEWVLIPQPVAKINQIAYQVTGSGPNSGIDFAKGIINFADIGSTKDSYMLRLLGKFENYAPGRMDYGASTIELCNLSDFYGDVVLKDDCINGSEEAKLQFQGDFYVYIEEIKQSPPPTEALIYFGTVTENYYQYLDGLNQPEGYDKGLAEPKLSYSNMTGGLGILYASNLSLKRIVF
jgi:hypothetical protein